MSEVLLEDILEHASRLPIFSLKKLALIRITTNLCNNKKLISLITKCRFHRSILGRLRMKNETEFKNVEATGEELISQMSAVGIYKDMILEFLWPVTYRIVLWIFSYASKINNECLCFFYWTDQGRIDNVKTAKHLSANEMVPIQNRIALARTFCLSEEIFKFSDGESFGLTNLSGGNKILCPLRIHWVKQLHGFSSVYGERIVNEFLDYAIKIRSKEAIVYIFRIMPQNMRSDKLIRCLKALQEKIRDFFILEEDDNEIGCFVISQIIEKKYPEDILSSNFLLIMSILLFFATQNEFLKIWSEGLQFASLDDIKIVLYMIFYKFHMEIYKDYDYRDMFVRAWEKLSDDQKESMKVEQYLGIICFITLVKTEFIYILGKLTSENINEFIISKPSVENKWYFLHFLIDRKLVSTSTLEEQLPYVLKYFSYPQFDSMKTLATFIGDNIENKRRS